MKKFNLCQTFIIWFSLCLCVPAFSQIPTQGLIAWFRADSGVVADGQGLVSEWKNMAGYSSHATQTTLTKRPKLLKNVLNSHPVIDFDGSNDGLTFTSPEVDGATNMAIFMVARCTKAGISPVNAYTEPAAILWVESASWGTIHMTPTQEAVYIRFGTAQREAIPNVYRYESSVGTQFLELCMLMDNKMDYIYVNGELKRENQRTYGPVNGNRRTVYIGYSYESMFWPGSIAEIIVYKTLASTSDRQQVHTYLQSKYFNATQTPSINLNPTSLGFFAKPGGSSNPAAQNVTVTAVGGQSLSGMTVTGAGDWLATSVSGTGDIRTIQNTVNISGVAEGNYSKTITVKAGTITKTYPVSLLVSTAWTDNFDGGKQQTWHNGAGTWSVASNKLQNSGSGIMTTWAGDPAWTDLTYTVEVTPASAVDVWVLFRVQDGSNYYLFTLNGGGGLWKVVNGSFTEIKQGSGSFSTGSTYTIKVELVGSSIKIYNGTTLILEATDTQFTKGYIGLGANNTTGTFDNVMVTGGSGSTVLGRRVPFNAADRSFMVSQNPVRDFISVVPGIQVSLYTCGGELVGTYTKKDIYIGDLEPGVYVLKVGGMVQPVVKTE